MHKQHLYRYLTLTALMGLWSCASTRQTAQNTGEVDDLYGNSASAQVYADNSSDVSTVADRPSRQQQRFERQQSARNRNPEYSDEQQGYDVNSDEYYSELSARKLNRGLSPDPGWNDEGIAYNSGFANGYNSAMTSSYSWNRWGFNNFGFYNGLNLGLGLGSFGGWGYNRFGMGNSFYNPFYSPFYGGGYAYSPFGYGGYGGYGSFYDPFYSPYAYGGYNSFYSPYYGGGGYYGGGYGRPVIVNNVVVTGADPYRNRTYGPRFNRSSNAYNDAFVNTPRAINGGGRRAAGSYSSPGTSPGNASANTYPSRGSNNGYYAAPRQNSRGSYYYDNSNGSGSRPNATTGRAYSTPAPSYNSGNSDYYAAPRQNSRGSYTPSDGGSRGSYSQPSYQQQQQSQPSYQQPSYQSQSRGSYSAPSTPSYSAPSHSSGGGSSYSGGGGGSRGPR